MSARFPTSTRPRFRADLQDRLSRWNGARLGMGLDLRDLPECPDAPGTTYWITGLNGAGKSTLGRRLAKRLRRRGDRVAFISDSMLRGVFGAPTGSTLEDCRETALRMSRLARHLAVRGIDTVCATVSMFHEIRAWNRRNLRPYVEVFLDVPFSALLRRDPDGLYSRALTGDLTHVVGVDLPIELPDSPHVHLVVEEDETPNDSMKRLVAALESLQEKTGTDADPAAVGRD